MPGRPIVIVSNRGPVSFAVDERGDIVERRGGGGLVSGLGGLGDGGLGSGDTAWFAASMSEGDRVVSAQGPRRAAGFDLTLIDAGTDRFRLAYDIVSNGTLWFLHHGLFDRATRPTFDDAWRTAWQAYGEVNEAFADAIASTVPPDAVVLVQDYHLALLGGALRARRPDLSTVHFHHTPFCTVDEFAVLPEEIRADLATGLAGFDACGFHVEEWAQNFTASVTSTGVDPPPTFAAALNVDGDELRARSSAPDVEAQVARLGAVVGDRSFIVRVDRIELSKNLLRGFDAFELLLERDPSIAERVVMGAYCYPSREGVPAYAAYREEAEARVWRIRERWGPVILWETDDDYARSLAALRLADVVLVNPVRDGLNLVAKEAAIIGDRWPSVVLSTCAGVAAELGEFCDLIHPFDVSETATAFRVGIDRSPADRASMGRARRAATLARTPDDWLADQLAAAGA